MAKNTGSPKNILAANEVSQPRGSGFFSFGGGWSVGFCVFPNVFPRVPHYIPHPLP